MCDAHEAAGVSCGPSMESVGSAVLAAPKVIAGLTLGVSAAVAVSFVVANIVWIGLGVAVLGTVAGTLLVRSTHRNLRTPTWRPGLAQTPTRVNGVRRPAVEAPRHPALEAPRAAALPHETARSLAELGGAILGVRDDCGLRAIRQRSTP